MQRNSGSSGGPGRPRDLARRAEILARCEEGFAEDGYAAASLSSLGERCGVSKAALVQRFGSKEKLYLDVLGSTVVTLTQLVSAAGRAKGSHAERLAALGDAVTDYFASHWSAARLLLAELVGRGPFGRSPSGQAQVVTALRVVEGFLRAGAAAGEFRAVCPQQLTTSIVGVHLVHFAAGPITTAFLGEDPLLADQVRARKRAIREQVAAMVLAHVTGPGDERHSGARKSRAPIR